MMAHEYPAGQATRRTGAPQTAPQPTAAAASSNNTISNYNQQRALSGGRHEQGPARTGSAARPEIEGAACERGQAPSGCQRCANGVAGAHHSGAAAWPSLTDGRAPDGLSSGADLNCRHLIRSPAHETPGRALPAANEPRPRQELEHYPGPPTGRQGPTDRLQQPARRQQQQQQELERANDGGGAPDRQSLFKRAASCLSASRRQPLPSPNSLASGRKANTNDTAHLAQVRSSSPEIIACGPIKEHQQQQQPQTQPQQFRGRPRKTIKSLAPSGASNWSRFYLPPINVGADQFQPANQAVLSPEAPKERQETNSSSGSIELATKQDADLARSDTVCALLFSSSSLVSSSDEPNQRATIRQLLRNSFSCELSSLCPREQKSVSSTATSSVSFATKLVEGSNNIGQATADLQRGTKTRRKKKRRKRSSSVQKVRLSIESNNMPNTGRQRGINLAQNRYIIEDRSLRNAQAQSDERRSTVCSSSVIDIHEDDDDYDSCDFSSPMANNNNNNFCGQSGGNSKPNRRPSEDSAKIGQGNSNDCNRPSQRQSVAESRVNILIKDNDSSACGAGGGGGGKPARHSTGNRPNAEPGMKERENWSMNIEFLLAVIGFAVDLGNIWRFPYICYRNGGGAFLIPYTIMFILGGLPIFYLEMSLGQYFSSGCLTVWKRVCPMAKGIGYAMCVLNFFTGLYYNTIISWAVFFFVESFTTILPWTNCNNSWNTGDCKTIDQRQALRASIYNSTSALSSTSSFNDSALTSFSSPTKDYFEREVLRVHLSSGIDDLGSIRRPLAIYLAIVFVCIYFAIWKGVKSTGKAVWITALLPYFVLIPLLVRGVFLEGAWLGIRYYLEPQWVKIFDVDVWVEAAKQIYFSLGPGFGTLMALSSYNKFHHNCRRDAFIAASVNYFASFIAGLVVFALLGYMATIMDVSISDVATEGPGLVFQVYPEGLATMRFSAMWSVLFFIMVITLGIDSTFGGLESVITGLCDEYPRALRAHRGTFIGFLIVLIYFCSLPTTTYGGNYVIYLLESYGTSLSLIFIVLVETIVVCWIYGADRFCNNLEEMYGERPGPFWRICWKYISPTILLLIFLAACGQELDKYHILSNGSYIYPSWAPFLGLLMTGSSVCCIPIYAVYYIKTKTSGTFWERLKIASRPVEDPKAMEKDIYGDTMIDKISGENDIHLNVAI